MKKTLVIVYVLLFLIASFGLATVGANSITPAPASISVPTVSEKSIVGTDYNLIANKIFKKFITRYPYILQQVSCDDMDNYVNKVIQKTKIKFRRPDINKENTVKHIFENLLRDYLNNNLECNDYIDVDRDDTDVSTEEYVKCVFDDGNNRDIQSCYSNNGKWACKGVGTCTVKVDGYVGENITWKSSLGGYAYTIIDGQSDYANFYSVQPQPIPMPVCKGDENVGCTYPIYEYQINGSIPKVNTTNKK